MPVRLPDPTEIPLQAPRADRPIVSYTGGIAAQGQEALGGAMSEAGKDVTQTGLAFQTANDQAQFATANSQFLQRKLALDQQFEGDQDYTTKAQRYGDAISQAANETASGIQSVDLRNQFVDRTMRWQEYGINQMQRQARANYVDDARSTLDQTINNTLDQASSATDPNMRTSMLNSIGPQVDAAVATGVITRVEGDKRKSELPNLFATRYAKTLSDTDPALAARLLLPGAPVLASGLPMELQSAIHKASLTRGADEEVLARTAQLESGGGHQTNPKSGAAGQFQFIPAVARSYQLVNPNDPDQSADAAARLQNDNKAALTQALGRDPTGPELYLAHQQGAAGAAALIQHPDLPAVTALQSVYGNPDSAKAAIVNNGGKADMSAGDFVDGWAARYNGLSSHAPGPTPQPTTDQDGNVLYPKTGDWRDFLRPDQRAQIADVAMNRAQAWDKAHEADAARQEILQQKKLKQASEDTETKVLSDITGSGSNPNVTAAQIADPNGPYNQLLPEAKMRMIDFLARNAKQSDKDSATYGPGFFDLFRRIHADPSDPNRISDPGALYDQTGPGRALTMAGADKLTGELKAARTPEGAADGKMVEGQMAYAKQQLSFSVDYGNFKLHDAKGEAAFNQAFTPAFFKAYDDGLKAGKSPFQLLSPSSPDYITDKLVKTYKRSDADMQRDMMAAGSALPAAGVDKGAPSPSFLDLQAEMQRRGLLGAGASQTPEVPH